MGLMIVPDKYSHETLLDSYMSEIAPNLGHHGPTLFSAYHKRATNENYAKASCVLLPGEHFIVAIYGHALEVSKSTSEERVAFLKENDLILAGVRGLVLCAQQFYLGFPEGWWVHSYDEKDVLWLNYGQPHVPYIYRNSFGRLEFLLGSWDREYDTHDYFLGFKQIKSPTP